MIFKSSRWARVSRLLLGVLWILPVWAGAQEPAAAAAPREGENLLSQAMAAFRKGDVTNAIALASKAIAASPTNAQGYGLRGSFHEKAREHARAIADYDEAIKRDPKSAAFLERRGEEQFRIGQFKAAIADFDRVIELNPRYEAHHWQRGIAYYYAGEFEKGRKQFELHQTVNRADVENAVWHFLCVARAAGPDKARAALIPIDGDSRVPMKQIHELFAGKAMPEDVLAAARAGDQPPQQLNDRLFYAHLYLGLYYEAIGDTKLAREHILKAAKDFNSEHYMGDVARVHAAVLDKKSQGGTPK